MARYHSEPRNGETKCSYGINIQSWFWCLVIEVFIALPFVSTSCLGVDIQVATYPQGVISIRYGDPLEIFCVAESGSSDDLEFSSVGKYLESEKINSTTRRLYIRTPEKQVSTIYCLNKITGKMCVNRVLVESPPANITDFNCVSRNLDVLNCSWTSQNKFSSVNYKLAFFINGNIATPRCTAEQGTKGTYFCSWSTFSNPRYRQIETNLYFYLDSCNIFGCNYQNFYVDHYSIVKPDPPFDLKVIKNGSHSVVLKWSIPNNIIELLYCGVEHIIEYQIANIENTTYFNRVDTSALPTMNKTYKFELNNLPYADMEYNVRIYIKSKKAKNREYWSDFSQISFYTAGERPNRPPEITAGAFEQDILGEKRNIYVYWKRLPKYEETGENFTYKVLLSQGKHTFPIIYPDSEKSLSYVVVKEVPLEGLNVNIWSVNANGSSPNSDHMYIPADKDIQSLRVHSFSTLSHENGTYELYWSGLENIDNYTLFWCRHRKTHICADRMDFVVLDSKKINHVIDLPINYRFQFAISANNGTKSSGLVWTTWETTYDRLGMYGFPVLLKYDAPGTSSVRLRWRLDSAFLNYINGYNISYCAISHTSGYCDETIANKYVIIEDPIKTNVIIENLQPFTTYQLSLSINTVYGRKSADTAVITTAEDKPSSPINVAVTDVKSNSLIISWDPPLHRNGLIGKYAIYNYDSEIYVHKVSTRMTDLSRQLVTLTGLTSFTNYSLTVQACNIAIDLCSELTPNPSIFVRTRIGRPSTLKAPIIGDGPTKLTWEPPIIPGGAIDLYQIRRVREEILNTTELAYDVTRCEGVLLTEMYQVRAVNIDKDNNYGVIGNGNVTLPRRSDSDPYDEYPGEWSPPSTVIKCT